jgi:tRNA(His) guanylyltransferase
MKQGNDPLGDRQKLFESHTAQKLIPRLPVLARCDGRAFSSFTRGLKRPFDERLSQLMIATTKYLVEETSALLGYTQSDEISLLWYSEDPRSQMLFDGKVLKLTSILAAMTTAYFNYSLGKFVPERAYTEGVQRLPLFDCRVWNVPTKEEAANYYQWREQDAVRNSIQMAAQSVYSHKELQDKNSKQLQDSLFQKGINWNDFPEFFRRGTYVSRVEVERAFTKEEIDQLPPQHEARKNENLSFKRHETRILSLPTASKIGNLVDVLFTGAVPVLKVQYR